MLLHRRDARATKLRLLLLAGGHPVQLPGLDPVELKLIGLGPKEDFSCGKLVAAAANRYNEAYAAWQKWEEHLGMDAPPRAWQTREHREAGAAAVAQALERENAAIEELKKALAALE